MHAVMQCQKFAGHRQRGPFVTGVVYADTVTDDDFYTPGEGWGDVAIALYRGDMVVANGVTWSTGGYSVEVPAGTYSLKASGGGMSGEIWVHDIVVEELNVKVDVDPTDVVITTPRRVIAISTQDLPAGDWMLAPDTAHDVVDGVHHVFENLETTQDHLLYFNSHSDG